MANRTHSLTAADKLGGAGQVDMSPTNGKLLLTGRQLASHLGVSLRLVEKWSASGVIPKLVISSRMTRYQLPKVIAALEQYETATVRK